jgi:hypothetical protein
MSTPSTDKPAILKLRTGNAEWRRLCLTLAETHPEYRNDLGSVNYHSVSVAARRAGFAEITDENYQSVIEALAAPANGNGHTVETSSAAPPIAESQATTHNHSPAPVAVLTLEEVPSTDQFSANFYLLAPNGASVQITLRGAPSARQIHHGFNSLMLALDEGHRRKFQPKESGKPSAAVPPVPTGSAVPPPPPVAPPVPAAPLTGEAQCTAITVGNGYKSQKLQLQFACVGFEKALTYTKSPNDMAALIAPLGFVPEHIVAGQTYPVNCKVAWKKSPDGKYTDVVSVKPA